VFNVSSALSKQVNFSFYPTPDCDWPNGDPTKCDAQAFGKAVCECDDIEICALHVENCVVGCSGSSLQKLANFFGCFSGEKEETCSPSKSSSCAKLAGIDHSKIESCVSDKSLLDSIYRSQWPMAKKVESFPELKIAGKSLQVETVKGIKKALCNAGASAAC